MVLNMSLSALWSVTTEDPSLLTIQTTPSSDYRQHISTSSTNNKNNKWTKRRRARNRKTPDTETQEKNKINNIKRLHPVLNSSLVIINLVYLIICVSLITTIPCGTDALIVDPMLGGDVAPGSSDTAAADPNKSNAGATFSLDDALNRFNMENQIAAIFSRVSYGSTTTKRSISDLGMGQSSLTTIPTPFLTTNR